jgi:hypothetical protein
MLRFANQPLSAPALLLPCWPAALYAAPAVVLAIQTEPSPMPARHRPRSMLAALLVLSAIGLVHSPAFFSAQAGNPQSSHSGRTGSLLKSGKSGEGLPAPVADMREAILEAVRSGHLEHLRHAVELNEVRPIVGDGNERDVLAAVRAASISGDGRDVLEAIGRILDARWVAVPLGADIENNHIYIWPRLAETSLRSLAPEDETELAAIVPPDARAAMIAKGTYDHWRIGIAADGTWHFLRR